MDAILPDNPCNKGIVAKVFWDYGRSGMDQKQKESGTPWDLIVEGVRGMKKRLLITLTLPDDEDWNWLPDELYLNRRLSAAVVPPLRQSTADLLDSVVATYRGIGVRFPEDYP